LQVFWLLFYKTFRLCHVNLIFKILIHKCCFSHQFDVALDQNELLMLWLSWWTILRHWRECFTIINAFLMSKNIGYESSLTFEQWIHLLLHGTESQCGVFSIHSMWKQIWIIFMSNVNIRLWEIYNMITKNCWSTYSIGFSYTSSAFCNGKIDFEPVLYELVVLEVIVAQDNQSDFPWIQSIILYEEEIWMSTPTRFCIL
jgi:hypothetical protein